MADRDVRFERHQEQWKDQNRQGAASESELRALLGRQAAAVAQRAADATVARIFSRVGSSVLRPGPGGWRSPRPWSR